MLGIFVLAVWGMLVALFRRFWDQQADEQYSCTSLYSDWNTTVFCTRNVQRQAWDHDAKDQDLFRRAIQLSIRHVVTWMCAF